MPEESGEKDLLSRLGGKAPNVIDGGGDRPNSNETLVTINDYERHKEYKGILIKKTMSIMINDFAGLKEGLLALIDVCVDLLHCTRLILGIRRSLDQFDNVVSDLVRWFGFKPSIGYGTSSRYFFLESEL